MHFEQDEENFYYYGNTTATDESVLNTLGFYYDHNEFDQFGNLFEVWIAPINGAERRTGWLT